MKNIFLVFLRLIGMTISTCNRQCKCEDYWFEELSYFEGELVWYGGECWRASAQGKGIMPGPFLENGNYIWDEYLRK